MTIKDQIAALEAENAQMRRSVPLLPTNRSQKGQKGPVMTGTSAIFNALKDKPGFKAFCARRINGKVKKAPRFKVPIPKAKSIWSVLGEYTTGRRLKLTSTKHRVSGWKPHYKFKNGKWTINDRKWGVTAKFESTILDETAQLRRVGKTWEFISEVHSPQWYRDDEPTVETLPQTIPRFGLDAQFKPEQDDPVISAAGPINDDQDLALVIEALEAQNALLAKLAARRAA